MRSPSARPLWPLSAVALLLACTALTGCQTAPLPPIVTLPEIVAWSQAKVPDQEIMRRVSASRTRFYLKSPDLQYLRDNGVGPLVIDYMIATAWTPERVYYGYPYEPDFHWRVGFFFGHRHCY
ncbi:MAG: hypothetical protein HYZ53_01095 [Planctomycetes bacterium]|nr:hypothetical protein [Planctomycetota bacterium]